MIDFSTLLRRHLFYVRVARDSKLCEKRIYKNLLRGINNIRKIPSILKLNYILKIQARARFIYRMLHM